MNDKHPVPRLNAKLTLVFFGVLAFFIYLPAFATRFGIHNDYCFLGYTQPSSWLCFPETNSLIALGRPLGAILLNVEGLFLHSLGSFPYMRLVSFALVLGSAWIIVGHFMDKLKMEPLISSAIGFCFVLMPGCQLFIVWLTELVPGSLNVLLSLLVYRVLEKAEPGGIMRRELRSLGWMAVAMFGFLLSLCIYPPTALTFLALTFAGLLFAPVPEWPGIRLKVIRDLAFAGAGMVLYFVGTKFILLPLFSAFGSEAYRNTVANIFQQGTYRFDLSTNLIDKLGEFASISSIAVGGALHPVAGPMSAWIVGGAIIAAFIFVAIRAGRDALAGGNWQRVAQRAAFGFSIILCASAPSLAAEKGELGYRVLTTYDLVVVLCVFAPLVWLGRTLPNFPMRRGAMAVALVSGLFAGWNVHDVARNYNRELLFIKDKMESSDKANLMTIMGITIPRGACYIERPMQLEFCYVIASLPQLAGAVEGLLPEVGLGERKVITYIDHSQTHNLDQEPDAVGLGAPPLYLRYPTKDGVTTDEQTLLIDLDEAVVSIPYTPIPLPSVRTSNGSGGRVLFDLNPTDYWQPGPAPQWLELNLPSRMPIDKLRFYAGPSAEGATDMPRDWHILMSDDGINWVLIATMTGEINWKAGEVRTYQSPKRQTALHYLFVFTAGNGPILKIFKIGF